MKRIFLFVAAAIAAVSLTPAAGAAQGLTSAEFTARLETARTIAVAGESRPSRQRMAAVESALGLPVNVAFDWGDVTIDRDSIFDALAGDTAVDFRQVVAHLDAMAEQILEAESPSPVDSTDVRKAMSKAFDGVQTTRSWIQVARERLLQLLASLFERIARATARGAGVVVALAVLGAIVVLGIWLVAARLRIVPERSTATGRRGPGRPDWHALAAQAESRGDLESAVRAHFQILLDELALKGIVEDEPSLTAGECRTAVADARPSLYPAIVDATDAFELVAYGHTPPRAEHIDRLRRATEAAKAA